MTVSYTHLDVYKRQAYPTLKRFLSGVDADVTRELVGPREPAVAVLHGARVRPLVHRRLARSVRILSRFHGN